MNFRHIIITAILIALTILGDYMIKRFFRYLKPHWNETLRDIVAWVTTVTLVVTGVLFLLKYAL